MPQLTPVVKHLLLLNILMFIAEVTAPFGLKVESLLGLHYFEASGFAPYQLLTYGFLHADFTHLFFNMFSLFMFGRMLETYWGASRFLIFYIVTGVGAALTQEAAWAYSLHDFVTEVARLSSDDVFAPIATTNGYIGSVPELLAYKADVLNRYITIGASGSVFGLLLAFGVIFPNLPLFIIPFPFPIKAKWFVIFYGLIELWGGISTSVGLSAGDGIAHYAHLGGMLFGLLLILWWRKSAPRDPRSPF